MGRTYKMGVIGLGEGRSIISAALSSTHWELVNICDLNQELCEERKKEFNLSRSTNNYQELLDDPTIDVIAIYTPDQLHGRHIHQALEAGKHVICTKPVLTSLDEAQSLLEAREKAGKQVFIGQSSRYFEPMRRQRADYEAGLHGQLTSIQTQYITDGRWFLEKGWSLKKGFSWMYNFLIHAVDLACWYFPDIVEVYGISYQSENTKSMGSDVPDVLKFFFKDNQGRPVTVEGAYGMPVLPFESEASISCTLRGTEGVSRGEYPNLKYHRNLKGMSGEIVNLEERFDYYFRFGNISHHAGEYQNYIDQFAQCLDRGETAKPDLSEALKILAVMAAMEKSLETGLPAQVSL